MKVQWISHKGKKVLFLNYNNIKSQDEMIEVLRLSGDMIRKVPDTVLSFVDMTEASPGPDFMKEAKIQGKELLHKTDRSAIIGITGLKAMLLKGYNLFSGEAMKPFATKEEALDYLVS